MKVLLHDLTQEEIRKYCNNKINEDTIVLTEKENPPHQCIGCFGCWIKTPGECVISDAYSRMGEYWGNCTEFIIISQCIYGEFSPYVKCLLDRSLSVCHPYFTKRKGRMHHVLRYNNHPKLTVYFYGKDLSKEEKETAQGRVKATGINIETSKEKVVFLNKIEELGGILI